MKPRAIISSSVKSFKKDLKNLLPQGISLKKQDAHTPVDYLFSLVANQTDLELFKETLNISRKSIVALPISFLGKVPFQDNLFIIYYYELLTAELDPTKGYANWCLSLLKNEGKIFLPESDLELSFITTNELSKLMARVAFSFFNPGEIFVFHKTTLYKLSDWANKIDSNLLVSVNKDFSLPKIDLSHLDLEKKELPLTGDTFNNLYRESSLLIPLKKKKISLPSLPKLKFPKIKVKTPKVNFTRPLILFAIILLLPGIIYIASSLSLTLAFNLTGNIQKTLLDFSESSNQTASSLISLLPDNPLSKELQQEKSKIDLARSYGSVYSLDLSDLESSDINSVQFESFFKKLSFYDANTEEDILPSLSRIDLLNTSRLLPLSKRLLGYKKSISYMIIFEDKSLINSSMTFTLQDGKVGESSIFSDNYIDDRMLGDVAPPEAIQKFRQEDKFMFRDLLFSDDVSKALEKAAWFNEKAFKQSPEIVAIVKQEDLSSLGFSNTSQIIETLKMGDIEKNKSLISTIYKLLASSSAKVWSSDPSINSVFTEVKFTGEKSFSKCLERNCVNLYFYPFSFVFSRNGENLVQKGDLSLDIEPDVFKFRYLYILKNEGSTPLTVYGKIYANDLSNAESYEVLKEGESKQFIYEWNVPNELDFNKNHKINMHLLKQDFAKEIELHLTVNGRSLYNTYLSGDQSLTIDYK